MRSAHSVPLVNESTFIQFRQPEGQGLIAFNQEHWTMMCLAQSDDLRFNSAIVFDFYDFSPLRRASMATRISIGQTVLGIIKLLAVKIGNTRIVNRVSPTQIFVMADYRKR